MSKDDIDNLPGQSPGGSGSRMMVMLVIMLALMMGWPHISKLIFGEPEKPADTKKDEAKDATKKDAPPTVTPAGGTPAITAKGIGVRPAVGDGKPVHLGAEPVEAGSHDLKSDTFLYRAQVNPKTGGLTELRLSRFRDRVKSWFDQTGLEPMPMPLVTSAGTPTSPLETFALIKLTVDKQAITLGPSDWARVPSSEADTVVLRLTLENRDLPEADKNRRILEIDKVFTARRIPETGEGGEGCLLNVKWKMRSLDGKAHSVEFESLGPVGVPEETRVDVRKVVWGIHKHKERDTIRQVQPYDKLISKFEDLVKKGEATRDAQATIEKVAEDRAASGEIWYAGVLNRFFAVLILPDRLDGERSGKDIPETEWDRVEIRRLPFAAEPVTGKSETHTFVPVFRTSVEVAATGEWSRGCRLFVGPKRKALFDEVQDKHDVAWELGKLIEYAQFGCCFIDACSSWTGQFIGYPLLMLLGGIARIIPNYGVAIIIMVLLVRAVMYPISRKSTMSMLRMKELQPKIAELQAKFADNKEELARKQMELYQKEGVNPISGCLPMFLQMPIWVGLWGALSAAVDLRHAPFMLWINDLSGEDALIHFAQGVQIPMPLCGSVTIMPETLNILPLMMAVMMFLQQKFMTPQAPANPEQQPINPKVMTYMMTGMFLMMLYSAPAGLNLYIMTSTLFGLLEQRWVKNHYEELKAKGLLKPAADAGPGWFGKIIQRVRDMQEQQDKLSSGKDGKEGGKDRDRKKKR